jgi:hypothetical protein
MGAYRQDRLPKAPCDLEEILSESLKFLRGLDGLRETYGEIALICAFAQISDQLARIGVEEQQRVTIARLGRDREYERAVDLFEVLTLAPN